MDDYMQIFPKRGGEMQESSFLQFLSDNKTVMNSLKDISLFSSLKEADVEELLGLSKLRGYTKGEVIIEKGKNDNWIYFLFCGQVNIIDDEQVIAVLKEKGDLFGEMSVVEGKPPSATVVAAENNTTCVAISSNVFEELLQKRSLDVPYHMCRLFAEIIANRLRNANQENIRLRQQIKDLQAG
jgi:CRP/FNR family transcriptional regulator, cyclic AMP receptor protein